MLRLIKDANEYAASIGEASDMSIESFADVVRAIDLIQQKQGIAGTTAKEAMHTIEGAARATQAAWKNVITAIAGGGDLQKAFDGLIQSLFGDGSEGSGLLANIIPRIQQTMEGIGQFVSKAAPYIAKYLPQLFDAILPPLLDSAVQLVISLASALPSIIKIIIETIPRLMHMVAQALQKEFPIIGGVFEGLATIIEKLFGFIADNGDKIMAVLAGVLAGFMAFKTISFFQTMIPQIITLVTGFVSTITGTVAAMELMGAASVGLTGIMGTLTGAVEMLNTALLANPIGLIVGAIVAAVAVLGIAIYHIATQEEAVKSLDEATKNHEETIKNLTSAQGSYIDSLKGLQDAQNELAKAQEETGLSGEELYNQFMQNRDAYMQMSPEQQRVLDLYIQMQEQQQRLKESTEELNKAQGEELVASFQQQASAIKENGGNWNELGANMRKAYDEGKIGADELQQLFGQAMTEMDTASKTTFVQNLPEDMRYATLMGVQEQETFGQRWEHFCSDIDTLFSQTTDSVEQNSTDANTNVTNTWQDIGTWFGDRWNDISNAFSGAADWFRDIFQSAKDGITNIWNSIGDFFSGIWEDIKSAFDIDSLFEWGSHMIENFIDGIKSAWEGLKSVVTGIGDFIASIFEHTTPKAGPLKGDDKWTVHMMDNFIGGIEKSKGRLKKSINSVADMMAEPMTMNVDGVFSGVNGKDGKNFGTTYNFYQTNNSPKALSNIEIYRRTKNQFSQLKGATV